MTKLFPGALRWRGVMRLYKKIRSTACILALTFIAVVPEVPTVVAQNFDLSSVGFVVDPSSVISILGRSTVGPFRCESDAVSGKGRAGFEHEKTGEPFVDVSLTSEVAAFDCKNGKITNDLQKALKGDEYPQVSLLIDAGFGRPAEDDEQGDYTVRVAGTLTVAGIDQPFDMTLSATRESFVNFRLQGKHDILMSDFDINPPSALLGMIKTRDKITLDFDILLSPTF